MVLWVYTIDRIEIRQAVANSVLLKKCLEYALFDLISIQYQFQVR
jgi:hypothetical protein